LFLLSVVPRPFCPRNGRNFKRKFTNEGDFPCAPPSVPPSLGGSSRRRRRRGRRRKRQRGKSRGAFPISALHHQRMVPLPPPRDFPPDFRVPFFISVCARKLSGHGETTAARNEMPRLRQKFIFPRAIVIASEFRLANCFSHAACRYFKIFRLDPLKPNAIGDPFAPRDLSLSLST